MNLEDQFQHYFGMTDIQRLSPVALEAGIERMRVDFGLEQDRSRRFALWALLFAFGIAPDLDVAFEEEADREAARYFMDLNARAGDQ